MLEQPNIATARATRQAPGSSGAHIAENYLAFSAWLPLKRVEEIDIKALKKAILVILDEDDGVEVRKLTRSLGKTGKQGFEVTIADCRIGIKLKARRIADRETMEEFVNPLDWPEGKRAIASHRAHISVQDWSSKDLPDADGAYDRALAVTLVTMALIDQIEPLAVLWHPARNALPVLGFIDEVEKAVSGTPPARLWVRWARQKPEKSGQGERIVTHGLSALLGREIELECGKTPWKRCVDPVLDLASGLIDQRLELHDGAVLRGGPFPIEIRHLPQGTFGTPVYLATPAPDVDGDGA